MSKSLVWWIPMLALSLALLPLPYGYYVLLRVLVCGACVYLANAGAQVGRTRWAWVLGGVAVLYNPIFPIRLQRELWWIINLATIWMLAVHMWTSRHDPHAQEHSTGGKASY